MTSILAKGCCRLTGTSLGIRAHSTSSSHKRIKLYYSYVPPTCARWTSSVATRLDVSEDSFPRAASPASSSSPLEDISLSDDAESGSDSSSITPTSGSKTISADEPPRFDSLKGHFSWDTLKAITVRPMNLTHMTPVQAAVLPLLPQLVEPSPATPRSYTAGDPQPMQRPARDLLVRSKTGTGKTLAFLVPAIESRLLAIQNAGKQELIDTGISPTKSLEGQARRSFAREKVGVLVLSPTRELASQIAQEAQKLTQHHDDFTVILFTGGRNKGAQFRQFTKGRKDIIVSTPGRLRDFLESQPEAFAGFAHTKMLILDEADTLLEMGFREDIEAIASKLAPTPERQTFLFSATVSRPIQQIAQQMLDRNHLFINTITENTSPVHAHVPQYHTLLPSASHQIPHIIRLIAHDQLSNPKKSKVIVFFPTTKMTRLFAKAIRDLSKICLPCMGSSRVYEIHSQLSQELRTKASDSFRKDGASILVTSDVSARGVDYPGVTRVIQVGIPSGRDLYVHRVGRTGRAGLQGRGDLVLLPWEIGFVTWQLAEVPMKPLAATDLTAQVKELAAKYDADPAAFVPGPRVVTTKKYATILEEIENNVEERVARFDEDSVQEMFASLLGYYVGRAPDIRLPKSTIVEGLKDWAVQACGLSTPPHISRGLLHKMGVFSEERGERGYDGGRDGPDDRRKSWTGRGTPRLKGTRGREWASSPSHSGSSSNFERRSSSSDFGYDDRSGSLGFRGRSSSSDFGERSSGFGGGRPSSSDFRARSSNSFSSSRGRSDGDRDKWQGRGRRNSWSGDGGRSSRDRDVPPWER